MYSDDDEQSTVASSRASFSTAHSKDIEANEAKIEDATFKRVRSTTSTSKRYEVAESHAKDPADSKSSSMALPRFDEVNMRWLRALADEIEEMEEQIKRLKRSEFVGDEKSMSGDEVEQEIKRLEVESALKMGEYYVAVLRTRSIRDIATSPNDPTLMDLSFPKAFLPPPPPPPPPPPSAPRTLRHTKLSPRDLPQYQYRDADDYLHDDPLTRICTSIFTNRRGAEQLVTMISILGATLFMVCAIVGLYFVPNTRARLGMVAVFTLLFAGCIALVIDRRSGHKGKDVFVATAAYAAVLVVFVSGNIAANPEPSVCILTSPSANANASPSAAALAPANSQALTASQNFVSPATVVVTALPSIQTLTSVQSIQTVLSTVISHVTPTSVPTATLIVEKPKGQMSDFAKTGIGVGAAFGGLFCLFVIGSIFLALFRKLKGNGTDGRDRGGRRWFGTGFGSLRQTRAWVNRNERQRKGNAGDCVKEDKGKTKVEEKKEEGRVVWV